MKLDRIIAVRNRKTIYRDGDRCLKVFDEDFSKADVLNEALNQARVEETGLNIPKVSFYKVDFFSESMINSAGIHHIIISAVYLSDFFMGFKNFFQPKALRCLCCIGIFS